MIIRKYEIEIPAPIKLFAGIIGMFLLIFLVSRIALVGFNYTYFSEVPFSTLLAALFVGSRFDMAITLYFTVPFFLINYIFYVSKRANSLHIANTVYFLIFSFFILFLNAAEIEYFQYFQSRLNAFFVNWEANPGFIVNMVWETYPVIRYFIVFGILTIFIVKYLNLLHRKFYAQVSYQKWWREILYFLFAAILMFIGIRGTISYKTPLRWGHAYFSTYNPANQLALNGIFNLMNDIIYQKKSSGNPATLFGIQDKSRAESITAAMLSDLNSQMIDFPLRSYQYAGDPKSHNIILILLESYSEFALSNLRAKGKSAYFDQYVRNGIYFPNFYSDGFHTYMGLFSSVFGMPNLFSRSIMKDNLGQQNFSGLLNILSEKGYHSIFGVPHDPNFDNMLGFLRGNGVQKVVSQFDFPPTEVLSTLGVADHKLFEKMNDQFREMQQPFIGIMMSSNNHGPWIIPEVEGQSFENTFEYTDWALHHFLQLARQEDYFKNTIFVISGDHGRSETTGHPFNLQSTNIPCLFYQPALLETDTIKTVSGHKDIPATLLGLLNTDYQTTNFSRDLLNLSANDSGFATFQEGKKLGIVSGDWYLIDQLRGNSHLYNLGSSEPLKDISAEYPAKVARLKAQLRAYYFTANDLFLKKNLSVK